MRVIDSTQVLDLINHETQTNSDGIDIGSVAWFGDITRWVATRVVPCSVTNLHLSVRKALDHLGLPNDIMDLSIESAIDGLLEVGDLVETNDQQNSTHGSSRPTVYVTPLTYIRCDGNRIFLIGVPSPGLDPIPESFKNLVQWNGLYRYLVATPAMIDVLQAHGYSECQQDTWLELPRPSTPDESLAGYQAHLGGGIRPGVIEDLEVINPNTPTTYYKGRWIKTTEDTNGTFVARRPRKYGSSVWCYVQIDKGVVIRYLELRSDLSLHRPCDIAWHLQAAIDAANGTHQLYCSTIDNNRVSFEFYSPLPAWAQRFISLYGSKDDRRQGCLFSYSFEKNIETVIKTFIEQRMWLRKIQKG